MAEIWRALAINLAAMALIVSAWTHLNGLLGLRSARFRHLAFGVVMGTGSIISMMLAVRFQPGVLFDLRTSFLIIAGYFGGPIGGGIAAALSAGYRLQVGGPGASVGLLGIGLAAIVGQFSYLMTGVVRRPIEVALLAVITGGLTLLGMTLMPSDLVADAVAHFGLPVSLLSATAVLIAALAIGKDEDTAAHRTLLQAAISQAPHYFYVKNAQSELVAVNAAVAAHHGVTIPGTLVGKTDFDLAPADRAHQLFRNEQEILQSGEARLDMDEQVDTSDGPRWFRSSKVPLRAHDGAIIGLVGMTQDITVQRRLEMELSDSRDHLSLLIDEMSVGVATFSPEGVLTYRNDRYQSAFPHTAYIRTPGTHIRDILSAVVQTGEQINIPDDDGAAWVDRTTSDLHQVSEEQVALFDGRWLQIRTHPTRTGSSLVVVSDITAIKVSEGTLLKLTDQLKVVATTDAMTGLLNRRAFDREFSAALRRSETANAAISLMMIDADHFKLYNDAYGHLAGDECLRQIAQCLVASVRSSDIVGRLGGEEFAVVLPDSGDERALEIAERFLSALRERALPHIGAASGNVSASVGLSSCDPEAVGRQAKDLLEQADKALYQSKAAGRARVTVFSQAPLLSNRVG